MSPTTTRTADGHPPDCIWLELVSEERRWVFQLPVEAERAVVVGSGARADVRFDGVGIAPVHFHFERDGEAVCMVPGYGVGVRLDGRPVTGPCTIAAGVIDFGAQRLRAVVARQAPNASIAAREFAPGPSRIDPHAHLSEIPSETQETRAVEPLAAAAALGAETRTFGTPPLVSPVRTESAGAPSLDSPLDPGTTLADAPPFADAPRLGPPGETFLSEGGPIGQATTAYDLSLYDVQDWPVLERPVVESQRLEPASVRPLDPGASPPRVASPWQRRLDAPIRWARTWLTRLGVQTKRRPLGVSAALLFVALALVVFSLGASRLIQASGAQSAPAEGGGEPGRGSRKSAKAPAPQTSAPVVPTPRAPAPVAPTSQASTEPDVATSAASQGANVLKPATDERGDPATEPTADPVEVATAVSHLLAGRYREAQAAYRLLAKAADEDAYVLLSELLARRAAPRCSQPEAVDTVCPEILP